VGFLEGVAIDGRAAVPLAWCLRHAEQDARTAGVDLPAETIRLLGAIRQLARETVAAASTVAASAKGSGTASVTAPLVILGAMTSREVAAGLGTSVRNVRDLAARGTLRGHRSGRFWAFDPSEVAEYMQGRAS